MSGRTAKVQDRNAGVRYPPARMFDASPTMLTRSAMGQIGTLVLVLLVTVVVSKLTW